MILIIKTKKAIILDEISIDRKIKRLSYEIFERNLNNKKILFVGIKKNGFILAKLLKKELSKICKIKIDITQVLVDKKNHLLNMLFTIIV